MRNLFSKSLLLTTSVLSFTAAPAMAQGPAGAAAEDDASTIVVTARRTEERLQDVPISITVFNQQQLSNRNVVTAGDIATYTPSLSANSRFGAESTSFAIRGFVQEIQNSPSVGVYFADVVGPRASGGTTGGNGAGVGSFFDLQNVQVLKGPQGTLFGRNTTGGAVLLVPQKPTGRFEGYVEGSIGNYDMRRIQGVVNVPVGDRFRARLSVDRQTRDGYLRNVSGIGPGDFADVDYTAVRLSVVADLTENLENYMIASYSLSDTNGFYPKIFTQDNIERDPFPALRAAQIAATSGNFYDIANGLPEAHQRIEQWQVINTTTWRPSDLLTFKNILSYAEFRQQQASNIYGENGYQNGTTLPYYAVAIVPAPGSYNTAQSTFTEELQLQGRTPDDRLTYTLGAYFELAEPINGFQRVFSPGGLACTDILSLQCTDVTGRGNLQISSSRYHYRNLGLFAQGTYKITDTISITGGIRYTSDITSGEGQVLRVLFPAPNSPNFVCSQPPQNVIGGTSAAIQANPALCRITRREASSKPTWLIDIDYKPTDNILLYAKYARGYRQGGVNVSSYGLENWKPEKVDLFEIGAKTSFSGFVRGTFNVAAFYNDFRDQQIAINTVSCANLPSAPACAGVLPSQFPASAQGIGNTGKSTIKGVEVDASISPFQGFNIDVGYAYIEATLKEISVPATPFGFALLLPAANVPVPSQLPLTPKNKYTVTASYTLPLDESIGRITLAATFTHQDSTFGSPSSVVLPGRSAVDNNTEWLPPQDNLNLNLNWTNIAGRPVDLALFATNVTKEKYHVYTTGASFGWDAKILNQPRMYGARLKYRFGQ